MRGIVSRRLIEAGWSADKKYKATDADGTVYLLRVYPDGDRARHKGEFDLMIRAAELGVPMAAPIEYVEHDGELCMLTEWIDGESAEEAVAKMIDKNAYEYGLKAGRALGLIHTIPAPDNAEPWGQRFQKKLDRKIQMYLDCPLKYERGELILGHIAENRRLLNDRPQAMHHGDYHIGNMMIDRQGNLKVIDFNRFDWGDPWEEFNRIVWSAQCSGAFASGTVDGYFGGEIPEEFWRLLGLYISSNALGSLPWAIPFGEAEINTMRRQTADIMRWYDDFSSIIPSWYRKIY